MDMNKPARIHFIFLKRLFLHFPSFFFTKTLKTPFFTSNGSRDSPKVKLMELESEDGTTIPIQFGVETVIGRELGLGFGPSSTDRTVSRRHLSLRLINDPIEKFRAGFEVIGKNPIWVCAEADGGRRIYKNSEKGELRAGDKVSLSLKKPSFWVVKRRGEENEEDEEKRRVLDAVERREKRTLERRREKAVRAKEEVFEDEDDEEIGNVDVSQIDPVKGKTMILGFCSYVEVFLFVSDFSGARSWHFFEQRYMFKCLMIENGSIFPLSRHLLQLIV